MPQDIDDILNGLDAPPSGAPPPSASMPQAAASGADSDVNDILAGLDQAPAPESTGRHQLTSKMSYPDKVAMKESGGNPKAVNPANPDAVGLGQFTSATWLSTIKRHHPDIAKGKTDAELLAMRTDPELGKQAISDLASDNTEQLRKNRIPVNDASLYGAHWLGADDFNKVYHADPNTPIEKLLSKNVIQQNKLGGLTADGVKSRAASGIGEMPSGAPPDAADLISTTAKEFLPDLGQVGKDMYRGIRHPRETAQAMKQIGIGLKSKMDGYVGEQQDPEKKASDEAALDAFIEEKKGEYSTLEGFENYVSHHPAHFLMDLSTFFGGAGVVGKGIGATTGIKAISAAGKVASTASTFTNPLAPINAVVRGAGAPAKVLDAAGNVVPKVDKMIQKVTDGVMSGKDLADPATRQAFAETVARKGVSEASVREGILRSVGLKAPESVVTKIAAPAKAREASAAAVASNNDILERHADQLAPPTGDSEIGAALDKAHADSLNHASSLYNSISRMPGSFGARHQGMDMTGFLQEMDSRLTKSQIPSTPRLLIGSKAQYPQAANAMRLLEKTLVRGDTMLGGDINASEILSIRKALNSYRDAATGADIKAMRDISDAFDQHIINRSVAQGLPGIGQRITQASKAYATHKNTFEEANGANNAIVSAVKPLKDAQSYGPGGQRMPSQNTDLYQKVQGPLGNALLHPTNGNYIYQQLQKATGNSPAVDQALRSAIVHSPPKKAAALLSNQNSVASKALPPDDLARARHLHAASVINNTKPSLESRAHSLLKDAIGSAAAKGAASYLGYEKFGIPGVFVGSMAEGAGEKVIEHLAAKRALAGAPHTSGRLARGVKKTAQFATSPSAQRSAYYNNQAQQDIQNRTVTRASGGKVDIEPLVQRLISRWKSAKKATDATTKPLLGVPDEAIAKALAVAQEHI